MTDRVFAFTGGDAGMFEITAQRAVRGEPLPAAARLDVKPLALATAAEARGHWSLRGILSNERYVTGAEKQALVRSQAPLGREEARFGALIPIRKTAEWWSLPQDERRAIFEDRSRHIAIGQHYLPAIARRLHHCRDLGTAEPFDFLTWFDFAREDQSRFDDLLGELRASAEWEFVDRELEIRVVRS